MAKPIAAAAAAEAVATQENEKKKEHEKFKNLNFKNSTEEEKKAYYDFWKAAIDNEDQDKIEAKFRVGNFLYKVLEEQEPAPFLSGSFEQIESEALEFLEEAAFQKPGEKINPFSMEAHSIIVKVYAKKMTDSLHYLAMNNHAPSQFKMGQMRAIGFEGPKDYEAAAEWFEEADKQNYPQAKENLEEMKQKLAELEKQKPEKIKEDEQAVGEKRKAPEEDLDKERKIKKQKLDDAAELEKDLALPAAAAIANPQATQLQPQTAKKEM